ncbi:MAG: hypothetical protein M1161_05695 [Candidatus Thermoplasmatota archaeon]|nr:hypothetical protein [Candidatus Thermoplasmatota archaeon]
MTRSKGTRSFIRSYHIEITINLQNIPPNKPPNYRKSRRGVYLVIVIVVVIVIAGFAMTYHPKSNSPAETKVLWAEGTFQIVPGVGSGSSGPISAHSSVGRIFDIYGNMSDIRVYGSFTSNQSVSLAIGYLGHNVTALDLPTIEKVEFSSGNTTNKSFSITLPVDSSSTLSDSYTILFSSDNPTLTEVNVTSSIVLGYNYS